MSLPVPSAAAHLASRAPEGTDLAVPTLWMEGWGISWSQVLAWALQGSGWLI